MKRILLASAISVVLCAPGVDNVWRAVDGVWDGDYTDTAHWSQGRVPTTNDTLWTANSSGATYTMTFPKGYVSSWASWDFRSGASDVVTVDGRGTTFVQEALDADGAASYPQWTSGKFDDSILNLERNSGGAQLKKAGLHFDDFLIVHSNQYHVILKQGTMDFSRNGGRTTGFTSKNDKFGSITIEPGATLVTAGTFDWRSCYRHSLIDVNGGTMRGAAITHPTGEGYNDLSGVSLYLTDLRVRNGGTVAYTGNLTIGNAQAKSTNRQFNFYMEGGTASFNWMGHSFGGFLLDVSGGQLTVPTIWVASGADSTAAVRLTGGTLVCNTVASSATGTSTFHSDGGTIVSRQNHSTFLYGFGTATLGSQGLTLALDHNVTVAQDFTDAVGAAGKLVKTGTGTLTLTGTASSFDTLELREGGLVMGDGVGVHAKLLVVNGCMPTISGSALTNMLAGLTLGDATTKGRLTVTPDATLKIDGPLSLPNLRLILSGEFAVGTTNDLIVAKGACADAVAAWRQQIVRGGNASGQAYAFDAAYDAEADETTFTMAVSEAAVVEKHATEDETLAAVELRPYDTYSATVDEGKTLSVEDRFVCGILIKDGLGRMTLATDLAAIYSGVWLLDGTMSFAPTFSTLDVPLTVNKSSGTTVIHTADDVTFKEMSVTSGGWVKHGPGTLTIENDGTAVQTLTATNGCVRTDSTPGNTEMRLGPDYPPPTVSWTGLSIAEGTVYLKGTGAGAKFNMPHSVAVGVPTRDGTVQPKLVVDACEAWTGIGSYHFFIAPNTSSSASTYFATAPEVVVTNGAKMRVDTLCVGDGGSDLACTPKLTVDGSTFLSSFKLQFERANRTLYRPEYIFRNGSRVYAAMLPGTSRTSASIEIAGPISLVCDDSVLAQATTYGATSLGGLSIYAGGSHNESTLEFRNKAVLWCWKMATDTSVKRLHMTFDDATWEFGAGTNLCVEKTAAVNLEVKAGGLTAHATTAAPLHVRQPFTGAGTLTKTGSATMWFDTRANWTASGMVDYAADSVTLACDVKVAEGAVAVSPGAASGTNVVTLAEGTSIDLLGGSVGGLILSGSGVAQGGTLANPVLRPAFNAEWTSTNGVVTLAADCAVGGSLLVDLGRDESAPVLPPYPRGVLVARYAGSTPPDVSAWNVLAVGGATGLCGKFTAADGEILMDVDFPSTVIIFR